MADKPGTPAVPAMRAQGLVDLAVRGLLRTPGLSRITGSRLVTLYVAGRKSGRRYTVPVSYLAHGDDLLIGTSSGWARNLRTGEPVAFRFKGTIRLADVQPLTAEPERRHGIRTHGGREPGIRPLQPGSRGSGRQPQPPGPAPGLGRRRAGHQTHAPVTRGFPSCRRGLHDWRHACHQTATRYRVCRTADPVTLVRKLDLS